VLATGGLGTLDTSPKRIRRLGLAALLAAGLGLVLVGQAAARGFVLHASAFMAHGRRPSVKISAEIPYSSLVFLKEDGKFMARYDVAVTIRDAKKENEVVRTAVFHGDAVADYYEETHSRERRARPSKTLQLAPGEYSIEAILSVKNTHFRYQRITKVVVPDFLASGIGFGTPEVNFLPFSRGQRVMRQEDFDKRADMQRADAEMVGLNVLDAQPVVQFELFLNEDVNVPLICYVYYEVRDLAKFRVLYGRSRARLLGFNDVFVLTFDAEDWKPGGYTVNMRAIADGGKISAEASTRMELDVTLAMLDEYFEDTLEILALIADQNELQGLATASEEMRADEWRKFWQKRDPNPSTAANEALEELLLRVRVASQRYGKFGSAWRTDRGMVYIRYGEPDKIEQRMDRTNRGEYEVWTYLAHDKTFVFYAQYAGGEYRLVEGDLF
jgi:GWxTD domain-containing protein